MPRPAFFCPLPSASAPACCCRAASAPNLAAALTGALGVTAIAIAVIGVLNRPLPPVGRAVAALAGVALLFQDIRSAAFGLLLLAGLWAFTRFTLPRKGNAA